MAEERRLRESAPEQKGTTMNMLVKLWNDESGASAAEYALILAIVGTGIVGAAIFLGGAISTAMSDAGDCIANPTEAECDIVVTP